MNQEVEIAGRPIGCGHPPYIIAEISANHGGDINRALSLMTAARDAGADAIKLQTYTPDTMTIDCNAPEFQIEGGLWDGRQLYDLYREAHTPWDWHAPLFDKGKELGISVFSTPFDETAVDLLASLDAPAYKIASFEIVDLPLIARVAREGKPMIISTGMASLGEIGDAVHTAREHGCKEVVLLHCVSSYPAPDHDSNVRTVRHLGEAFGCSAGLSDHTLGSAVAVASVALGAAVVEKHLTLSRADGGPDAAFSLEPEEFRALVTDCKRAWVSLGKVSYDLQGSERGSKMFRRSLYVVREIHKGETLTPENVRSIRPGFGLPPKMLPEVLGKMATRNLVRGEALDFDMFA